MCMKYENQYRRCADFIGIAYPIDEWSDKKYLFEIIEDLLEAEIDEEKAEEEFMNFLDLLHEKGIMKPKKPKND